MSDRPGSLATLARHCGEQDVNILGLQIFPGLEGVTDELVLRVPDGWGPDDVATLVEGAGGARVTVAPCTEHALVDGPIQYLHALRRFADEPSSLPELLARLLDAAPGPGTDQDAAHTLTVQVGPQAVTLHRAAPFTATEHARAVAFAEVAAEVASPDQEYAAAPAPYTSTAPVVRLASGADAAATVRMHDRCSAETVYRRYATPLPRIDDRLARRLLAADGGALVAVSGSEVVGVATVSPCEGGAAAVTVLVEDGWQRHGLGSTLLTAAARLARGQGADEVVLRGQSHNPALTSLAFAAGLRARVRLEGDTVVVTASVAGLKPFAPVPDATTASQVTEREATPA
jgi:GNAT superfamily N-acetyltransferase